MDQGGEGVINKQNEAKFINLLVAMRFYYDKAKVTRRWRVTGNILVALMAGYVVAFVPFLKENSYLFALIGLVWLIISRLFLTDREKSYAKIGATIQEEFDTTLFELPWNKTLVGSYVLPEIIKNATRKFNGDRKKLENWYIGLNAPTHMLNVLLAQRTNLVWDTILRKRYALIVAITTIVYFAITIVVGLSIAVDLRTYCLALLIPSASIILHGIETSRDHWRRYRSCEKSGVEILTLYSKISENHQLESLQSCREYQDFIFQKRCDNNLIPNKMYWLSRDKDDELIKTINEELSTS